MNPDDQEDVEVEPWQIENYRYLEIEECFARLGTLGFAFDRGSFSDQIEQFDSPEELAHDLCDGVMDKQFEQVYLLVFEIWRRLFPEKESLSIFCDKIDHAIGQYNQDELSDEELLEVLNDLQRVLDDNVDQGGDPKAVFATVSSNMAHDLQRFLYDFALGLIDEGSENAASEIVENFYSYLPDHIWFDFLRVRVLFLVDEEEAEHMCLHLIDYLAENVNTDLLFEILEFLIDHEATDYFDQIFAILIENVRGDDLHELLELCIHYFSIFDQKETIKELKSAAKKNAKDLREILNQITLTGLKSI